MEIIKIFNNNSVAAMSEELGDIILTGSGIGFQKKIGDTVEENRIEKTYIFQDGQRKRFEQSIKTVPTVYFEITDEIVKRATAQLKSDFSGEIFLAISDYISFAIKRKNENIKLTNLVLSEVKYMYQKEYQVGLWAIDLIEKRVGIKLDSDEAGYIALYLVNFSLYRANHNANKIITLTKDILNVIRDTMKISWDEDTLDYARITMHLKYLAERIISEEQASKEDTTASIRKMLKEDTRLSLCINRIVKMIKKSYDYSLSPDEQTYLCIHIKQNLC